LPGKRSTLRAGVFYYDFEDMQVRTIALLENRVTSVIDNAAAARIRGVDVSATARVSDRATFAGGLVWLPTREFVEFIAASSGASLAGNTISRAPEWSLSASIGYRLPVGNIGEVVADVDYNYRSEIFFTKENDPLLYQEGFGLLNLVVRFESSADDWHVFASLRNLLDTDYFNQMLFQSAPGHPARYEVGFGWRY
jgi:iron complex outermembrane receptor protein